jgi:hypothetical protein
MPPGESVAARRRRQRQAATFRAGLAQSAPLPAAAGGSTQATDLQHSSSQMLSAVHTPASHTANRREGASQSLRGSPSPAEILGLTVEARSVVAPSGLRRRTPAVPLGRQVLEAIALVSPLPHARANSWDTSLCIQASSGYRPGPPCWFGASCRYFAQGICKFSHGSDRSTTAVEVPSLAGRQAAACSFPASGPCMSRHFDVSEACFVPGATTAGSSAPLGPVTSRNDTPVREGWPESRHGSAENSLLAGTCLFRHEGAGKAAIVPGADSEYGSVPINEPPLGPATVALGEGADAMLGVLGTRVCAHGLTSEVGQHLNNQLGVVVQSLDTRTGRVGVLLDGHQAPKAFRLCNLTRVASLCVWITDSLAPTFTPQVEKFLHANMREPLSVTFGQLEHEFGPRHFYWTYDHSVCRENDTLDTLSRGHRGIWAIPRVSPSAPPPAWNLSCQEYNRLLYQGLPNNSPNDLPCESDSHHDCCSLSASESGGTGGHCPSGHPLQAFSADGVFECDICLRVLAEGDSILGCHACDYGVCPRCDQDFA